MAEFNIKDVVKVLEKLKMEIEESGYKRDVKEDLAGVLEIVVNTPNLLRENDKLEATILKKRGELSDVESRVYSEVVVVDARILELKSQVLTAEANTADAQKESERKIREFGAECEATLSTKREQTFGEIERLDREIKDKNKELAFITSKTDAAEARLKVFKENVAKMNVSDM